MDVLDWLLDSDPAIRWQVLRDLADAPAEQVAAERARVEHEGWGARVLALQRPDGHWDVRTPDFSSAAALQWWESMSPDRRGTLFPEWTSTTWSLSLLRDFGLDPAVPAARRAVARVAESCRWEHDGQPYFAGEVEPCINGRALALGAYFGQDVAPLAQRLLGEQLADGGWNCEQENGSIRGSFHTSIAVLEGLLAFEQATGGDPQFAAARARGQEFLLARRMRRSLSTGEVIEQDRKTGRPAAWAQFSFPTYWHYNVLRGLDHLRAAGAPADPRLDEALELVAAKRAADGRWPLENQHPGRLHFPLDEGEGRPGKWNTLRAMRVLRWFAAAPGTPEIMAEV